jgi:hypothetical protein
MRTVQFPVSPSGFAHLHASFLAMVPRIVAHGQVCFRHVRCPLQKEDAIAEMLAITWLWHIRLAQRGKDAAQFVTALASYAARSVHSGQRLTGMERSRDLLSPLAQRLHGFAVGKLPDPGALGTSPLAEALCDNMQTPVLDQVAFRHDFPLWRRTRTERDRRIIEGLMVGERPLDLSRQQGVSPGRISQLRREFREDWSRFCGEDDEIIGHRAVTTG